MNWFSQPIISIRVLGKDGLYPGFSIEEERHLFISRKERVWSAVVQEPLGRDWFRGEMGSLLPEHVRLFSAIMLSEVNPWRKGLLTITHWTGSSLSNVGTNLLDPQVRELIEEAVLEAIGDPNRPRRRSLRQPKGPYSLHTAGTRTEAIELLYSIDMEDQLLLAGLARWLGGCRLLAVMGYEEEAAIALLVSMGAALEWLRQALPLADDDGATFEDVYQYIGETFPQGSYAVDFFQEMYDYRITAIHPSNRFGEFWTPPIMMGDLYELRKSLMAIYRHIIVRDVPPTVEEILGKS